MVMLNRRREGRRMTIDDRLLPGVLCGSSIGRQVERAVVLR